eukprot:123211-Chlamydomonas_euryale.AAC.2
MAPFPSTAPSDLGIDTHDVSTWAAADGPLARGTKFSGLESATWRSGSMPATELLGLSGASTILAQARHRPR